MAKFRALKDGDRVKTGTPGDYLYGTVRTLDTVKGGYLIDWDTPERREWVVTKEASPE